MERRHFLKLSLGFIAGASVLAAGAEAAPLPPVPPEGEGHAPKPGERAEPAVTTQEDVDRLAPEEVRWRRHWGWRRRHWGWRRRRFWGWRRRRYWGYRRRWHRRHWRRHYWRRRYW
jgi:hypothetical protein